MKSKLAIFALLGVCLWAGDVRAESVSLNPGPAGSTFNYQNFDFSTLAGTAFQGQTQTLDIDFGVQFLVAPEFSIELFLNQSGALGTNPNTSFSITGTLLNGGSPVGNSFVLSQNLSMPAQIWPGWPFTLNGSPFLPATSGYGVSLFGTSTDLSPGQPGGYNLLIDPLIFSELELTINYPTDNASLVGSRLQLSSFETYPGTYFTSPIFVSPSPVPQIVATPEPATWERLGFGLLIGLGRKR